jgi:glyoxylase-like metal-dependent hydrolase (beta-lactamase superfamily II)
MSTALVQIAPGIRRLLAPNPGMMTGPGTNTYLIGEKEVAVLDPGPADESHLQAILEAVGGRLDWIWLTHAHPDHASGVKALKEATGAKLACWPVPNRVYEVDGLEPMERPLSDGMELVLDNTRYLALHTPGHASDHVCFFRPADGWLFTGDVVVAQGSVLIAPPDGNLADYLNTLDRLQALNAHWLAPGHGDPIADACGKLTEYKAHRLMREAQVLGCLTEGPQSVKTLVSALYAQIDPRLHELAGQQLLGHLLKLQAEGRVAPTSKEHWILSPVGL